MVMIAEREAAGERLMKLLSFLNDDPDNVSLALDAAATAFTAGEPEIALSLSARLNEQGALSPPQIGELGLAALAAGAYPAADTLFGSLFAGGETDPGVRFNLAYARAGCRQPQDALALLTPDITQALPQAAALEVRLLHELGEFERALETARLHLVAFPDDRSLLAAASVLAIDNEDRELARDCARRAGNHPEALATLGTLSLGDADIPSALDHFGRALDLDARAPRSWIGQGLARLASGDAAAAASDIDRGADLFNDHIGSWLAAGWAWMIAGDAEKAAERFERARQIDPAFAETVGSLAVIDAVSGRHDEARRKSLAALRLDRESFTALFAQSLLQAGAGQSSNARQIFDALVTTPVGVTGLTVSAMVSKLASGATRV